MHQFQIKEKVFSVTQCSNGTEWAWLFLLENDYQGRKKEQSPTSSFIYRYPTSTYYPPTRYWTSFFETYLAHWGCLFDVLGHQTSRPHKCIHLKVEREKTSKKRKYEKVCLKEGENFLLHSQQHTFLQLKTGFKQLLR